MHTYSGIIRKIDDVGRVVIPKEIRDYLRIAEGSAMEIGINDRGEVVLHASSNNYYITRIIELIGSDLQTYLQNNIIFILNDEIIASFGVQIDGKASASIIQIIKDNKPYVASVADKTTILPISQNSNVISNSQIIMPFQSEGYTGAVVACGIESSVSYKEIELLKMIAKICSR